MRISKTRMSAALSESAASKWVHLVLQVAEQTQHGLQLRLRLRLARALATPEQGERRRRERDT